MNAAVPLRVALVGNPNCGKTALFNALTGSRQRVANYAGVTVERKVGFLETPAGRPVQLVDLPGTYSLRGRSPDEIVARDVILGWRKNERAPDVLVCVADATNLRLVLRLVLELRRTGRPTLLALNMMDIARRRGVEIDIDELSAALGVPVIPAVAVRRGGTQALREALDTVAETLDEEDHAEAMAWTEPDTDELRALDNAAQAIIGRSVRNAGRPAGFTQRLDRLVLHPLAGPVILLAVLFLVFQAVFSWAEVPMDFIESGFAWLQGAVTHTMPAGPLRNLLVEGLISGVGAVIVFLPQILILFLFIILLEDFGYMARAAFLMDRTMGRVGLHGRAFIPLLSSFACAIPGIMAARVIENPRDRLVTTMIAPLMTCSARIPVYTLLIAAFVPRRTLAGGINLQGLVMFGLYAAGIVGAILVAWVLKRTILRGALEPLLLELPDYKLPSLRNVYHGLTMRAGFFLRRAGTIIAAAMVVLWFLSSYPAPPPGRNRPGHRLQLRRHAGPRPAPAARAGGLQLADRHRPGYRPGRPGGDGGRAGNRLCGGRGGRWRRPRAGGHAGGAMDAAGRPGPARLVRVRAAVHVHARRHPARDQFMALAGDHGGLHVRTGLRGGLRHVPRRQHTVVRSQVCGNN